MELSKRAPPYIISEYSLTSDLLFYLTCGLQYRYMHKGRLPPSSPVRMWFGEFIHSVMEEAYLMWKKNPQKNQFPWEWKEHIRKIELKINARLTAKGLVPPATMFCPYPEGFTLQGVCKDEHHPHKHFASARVFEALNVWGKDLFPLINEAEVKLKGLRKFPGMVNYSQNHPNYFGITGVVDVVSSVTLKNYSENNKIFSYLRKNPIVRELMDKYEDSGYEIIIDYKGMRRPPTSINNSGSDEWKYHEWQVMTYAWLRSQQLDAKPLVAGIVFYFNELYSSRNDLKLLKKEIQYKKTDIVPHDNDLGNINGWDGSPETQPELSKEFLEERSIRIIPFNEEIKEKSLKEFDSIVEEIENSIQLETEGKTILNTWKYNAKSHACRSCDFHYICPAYKGRSIPTVP